MIELLIVVLIIGILAAIALPQYQQAVEKSKSAPILALVKALGTAGETYYMEHGTYPTRFDQLEVKLPQLPGTKKAVSASGEARSNADVSFQIIAEKGTAQYGIWATRLKGKYKGGVILYWWHEPTPTMPVHKVLCAERTYNDTRFTGKAGDFCQKLFHASSVIPGVNNRYYRLP